MTVTTKGNLADFIIKQGLIVDKKYLALRKACIEFENKHNVFLWVTVD